MEIQYNNFLPTFEFILQYLSTAETFELLQFCTFILTGAKGPSSEYCWIQVLKVSHSGRRAEIYSYTAVVTMFVITGINCSRNTRINGIII